MDAASVFDRRLKGFFSATIGRSTRLSLSARIKLLSGLAFQTAQARKRARAAKAGKTVPPILIASVTRRCNLDCAGCYSKALRPEGRAELSDARFLEIFREAIELGTGTIMLAGGEPLVRRGLLERAAELPGILLPVFTNGTLVDEGILELFASGSLVPVFSIEGEAFQTALRRGGGIHEKALASAAALRAKGALFGFSLTLTSRNAATVLSRPFLESLAAQGPALLFLIEYVPIAAGGEDLVLTAEQKEAFVDEGLFEGLRCGVVKLPGDEEEYGGCLAAGRGFIHLSPEGDVEACPFAPFSDSGAAESSLESALDSPLMRAIRSRHAELTETKGGCALWNKKGWVASLSACSEGLEVRRAPPVPVGSP
ncbi:MAG: radical SAM protein [Spirochaetaceae bacterium]|nr:radical SAM protein [Spirochaetaceae bacterium]